MLVALLVGCKKSTKEDSLSTQQWNDLVNRSFPPGSKRVDVEKFLDERGIEHSYIAKSNFPEEVNTVVALVKNENDNSVVKKSGVQLKFKFDMDERLVSSEARDIFTGP
jgi:hypothetical protein